MSGTVYLVGAGPGDPGLLTARALELIARADVILYDRLIPTAALDGARADAELLFVGKEGGGPSVPQERTQQLMLERARAGAAVVRLKGGDPFVFGRGGEEALALRAAGIPFEVVPGVTAGVAASAYAGIPVTHRGLAGAVALVTGHARASSPEEEDAAAAGPGGFARGRDAEAALDTIDWPALAAFPGTLVLYMAVSGLPEIAAALLAAGRPGSQPAAVVEAGTLPRQRTICGTLETIARLAGEQGVRAPAITVVGAVAALAGELAWLPPRPLAGLTVAITRARAQASGLARRLEALGAEVVQAPAIRIRALPASSPHGDGGAAAIDPSPYDLVCLASANAVELLFERLDDRVHPPGDARALAHARVAAIGPATARALAARGVVADVVPERAVAESLVQALAGTPVRRALVARALQARDVLPEALRERGAEVDVLGLYETVAEPLDAGTLARLRAADYVTFTSSSTVRFLLEAIAASRSAPQAAGAPHGEDGASAGREEPLSARTRIVSIGPVTSEALREHGLQPHVEAERHDVGGLIDALVADAERTAKR
ncbi:MAG TPA: uroporphyrinogen-III C-methyltransferase [Solirubrobacteraceae bacterium]|nr:uroporphyrinogen-III C-methyltransferase [Solirubrobacteraceae bacterium]